MVAYADLCAPDLAAFEALVDAARADMPAPFAKATRDVRVLIEDFAPDALLDEMEIEDAFGLTGLYDGIPMTQKSVMDQAMAPDTVWLFRRPIMDEWADRGDVTLAQIVTHVLVHELAHHLGWSDDDIASIDQWWL